MHKKNTTQEAKKVRRLCELIERFRVNNFILRGRCRFCYYSGTPHGFTKIGENKNESWRVGRRPIEYGQREGQRAGRQLSRRKTGRGGRYGRSGRLWQGPA